MDYLVLLKKKYRNRKLHSICPSLGPAFPASNSASLPFFLRHAANLVTGFLGDLNEKKTPTTRSSLSNQPALPHRSLSPNCRIGIDAIRLGLRIRCGGPRLGGGSAVGIGAASQSVGVSWLLIRRCCFLFGLMFISSRRIALNVRHWRQSEMC